MNDVVARRLVIRGRVQGVGYRDALQEAARAARIAGWVRNRRDGTVEAFLQGPQRAVDEIAAWAAKGPPAARVIDVDCVDADVDTAVREFVRLPTA